MRKHGFREGPFRALKICLQMERKHLYHRINERSSLMMESGLIQETEGLINKGYSPNLKPLKSLGYRHVIKYLQGEWDLDETVKRLQADTRRYAKRQLTWFRADPEVLWMTQGETNNIIKQIQGFV